MSNTDRIVLDEDARCCAWLDAKMGYGPSAVVRTAIGYERDGELVAAVVFDNLTDNNVFAHTVNTLPTGFPAALLRACYLYAYEQLGLERVSLLIAEDNERARGFVEKWGAELEGRLARGTRRADLLIYVRWRDRAVYERLSQED